MLIFTCILYAAAGGCLLASLLRDRGKTRTALRKSWRTLEGLLPQFLAVIIFTGLVMAVFDPQTVSRILGAGSGWLGTVGAAAVGAVTLMPGFVAFPAAALLIRNGAGYMQIGAFVSSLMMVGVITLPVEIRYFGRKIAAMRNLLAFAFSFLVAAVIGAVCG